MSSHSTSQVAAKIRAIAEVGDPWATAILLAEENDRLRSMLNNGYLVVNDPANAFLAAEPWSRSVQRELGEIKGCMGPVRARKCDRCPHTRHSGVCAGANGEDNGTGCQCPGSR